MIQAITKEYFKEKVGHPEFEILDISLENTQIEQSVDFSTGYKPIYFMIPGYGYFVNLYGISKIAVPVTNEKPINIDDQIIKGTVNWSNWELKQTELVRYSENEFNRIYCNGISISGIKDWPEKDQDGKISSWCLTNKVTGEEIRFSVKYHNSRWYGEQINIAFESMLKMPCNISSCQERIGFIGNILTKHWGELTWIK